MRNAVAAALLSIAAIAAPHTGAGAAAVADPVVSHPPSAGIWGHPLWDSWFSLDEIGYEEAEYFVSGVARALDGRTAPYTTRIIVTRPSSAARFNGSVLLDWVNVTAQFENAVDTLEAHEMLVREGWAWVHVSAQSAGVCCSPLTPKVWDPVRYATLSHPGDDFSFDIFSQVAKAIRAPAGLDPMDGLAVERVIAAGQSQSAGRLYSYVTQVQDSANVVDAFLIHGGGSKTYTTPPSVPVLHLLSDFEASPAQPSTTHNYRLWEIAGSSHSNFWLDYHQEIGQGPRALLHAPKQPATADDEMHAVAGNYGEQIHPKQLTCIVGGSLFPTRYATSAALHHLNVWVESGVAPPGGPRFAFDANGRPALDADGNARGGIRLPPIEVPIARYVSTSCGLGGVTIPFTEAEILLRYPTHADYYDALENAAAASVADGYLLPEDAADLLQRACAARNRWADLSGC